MSNRRRVVIWIVLFVMSLLVVAQDDACPTLVQDVLTSVQAACADLGRNQVCYGNTDVIAFDFNETAIQDFETSGDTVDVFDMSSLSTAPMDVNGNVWGVALLALQANLPDTTPGQNVTFVVYGDTQLTNEVPPDSAIEDMPTITATSTGALNVRRGPGTNYGVIGALAANDEIMLQGRNEAGDWAQFTFDGGAGWVYVPLLMLGENVTTLSVVEVGNERDSRYTMPMQAFQLRTGIGTPACAEAPRDGLLVQAPQNTTVYFRINGIDVEVGSTALIQQNMNDEVRFYNLQGSVVVTSNRATRELEQGESTIATAITAPSPPELFNLTDVRNVPTSLLPDTFPIGFDGVWTNIDGDGSMQTLTLTYDTDTTYQLHYFDDGASSCDPNRSTQYSGEGTTIATVDGNTLSATIDFVCDNPDKTIISDIPISFTYDFETHTLADSFDLVWSRAE